MITTKRFALSGPSGSGKTTIMNKLNVPVHKMFSCTREAIPLEKEFFINGMQDYIILRSVVVANMGHSLIVDRCVLDAYVYTKLIANGDNPMFLQLNNAHKALQYLKNFEHIFLFEPLDNVVADNIRWTDTQKNQKVYDEMLNILKKTEIQYTIIEKKMSIKSRIKLIEGVINESIRSESKL